MTNQDEESNLSSGTGLIGYQFFSSELYHNYFTDQPTPPPVVPAQTGASPAQPVALAEQSAALPFQPALLTDQRAAQLVQPADRNIAGVPELSHGAPYAMPAVREFVSQLAAPQAEQVETPFQRVEYSLNDVELEPTFEERVAAMSSPIVLESAPEPNWNRFEAPAAQSASQLLPPEQFSANFSFNRSLLKIFWRIDVDHNNRVSKRELAQALDENWFSGDERLLAKLLHEIYEDISPEAIFCDAGLSVNNIYNFPPFAELAATQVEPEQSPAQQAPPRATSGNSSGKKIAKSAQSLRRIFNGR